MEGMRRGGDPGELFAVPGNLHPPLSGFFLGHGHSTSKEGNIGNYGPMVFMIHLVTVCWIGSTLCTKKRRYRSSENTKLFVSVLVRRVKNVHLSCPVLGSRGGSSSSSLA